MPFVFLLLQIPFLSTRLFSHLCKTPGCGAYAAVPTPVLSEHWWHALSKSLLC
jgi:hypothetical protein